VSIPTNMADAVAGIRDGTIGIQQVMIGDIVVSALIGLRTPSRYEVTSRPVQSGYSIELGMIQAKEPIEMTIILTNPDYSPEGLVTAALTGSVDALTETWVEKRDTLYAYQSARSIIPLTTHDRGFSEVVVELIDPRFDPEEDWDAWIGDVTFRPFSSQSGESAVDLEDAKTAANSAVGSF
jgi:hypothetical protein